MTTLNEVKRYWQEHPLHGFELTNLGSREFFDHLDGIKREDIERFALDDWGFKQFQGKRVLDVGCGPGWFTVNYALGGADVYAVDLTPRAVELTQRYLEYKQVTARVEEGNSEKLQFEDKFFDLVVAAGILHHTPNMVQAIRECFRVLKPGGEAKVALYHKGILHHPFLFPLTKAIMKWSKTRHPGADLSETSKDVDDFIRQYDGTLNPLGIGKSKKDWLTLLKEAGFMVSSHELHYFPKRFIPFNKLLPDFIHYLLDRFFGTMIYFNLKRQIEKEEPPKAWLKQIQPD